MKTLAELKASNLPKATAETVWLQITSDTNPEAAREAEAKLNEYLSAFTLMTDGKCIQCGAEQGGMVASIMGTGFQYGFIFGEGTCGTCGYPARAKHRIDGLGSIDGMILQYHPDYLVEREPAKEPEEVEA